MSESDTRGRSSEQPQPPPPDVSFSSLSPCSSFSSTAARGCPDSVVSESVHTDDEERSEAILFVDGDDDDPRGRQLIRQQYRELIDNVQQDREEMISLSNNKLTEAMKKADKLFLRVRQTREAVLDAQFLVLASNLGLEKANQIHTDMMVFDASVFAEHLLTFMGLNRLEAGESDDTNYTAGWLPKGAWTKLGKESEKYFKRAPTFHYMLGSFKAEPPTPRQKIERQKRVPKQKERRMMPTLLKKMVVSRHEATEKEVERILGLLQQYFRAEPEIPINFFDFVIDPHSFPRSVENIFHVSFIVRDGFAAVKLDQDKLPIIEPVGESMGNEGPHQQRQQMVISLSPQEWRQIIDTFEITEAMIPRIQHED